MASLDLLILVAYLLAMLAVGIWFSRRSAGSMKSYFLGDNKTRWWMLAASGAASNYDVTGTMFLVSLFYIVGLRSFWMLWSWQFFGAAFLMSYMAVWIRRTRVMTAVELMRIRFGDDRGGRVARAAGAILMVTFLVVAVGYSFTGIAKFLPIILPEALIDASDPVSSGRLWAMVIMGLTTIYVTAGGFSGVVVTDVIQTVLMSIGGILVGVIVYLKLDAVAIEALHTRFELDMLPRARLDMPAGYESWNDFGVLCLYWAVAGLLLNMSGAGGHYQEQRFLATRSQADAAKAGAAWGFFLIPRWAMIAGFAFIAATGMVGTDDPEQILPVVLVEMIPCGVRGLLLAALIAAFMSTFSSTINAAASMVVRDLVQPARPQWSERRLVRLSYGVTVAVVAVGVFIGFHADSIRNIWVWMIAGLIGGTLVPNVLRWGHWWRLNGWGYSIGIFGGLATALTVGGLSAAGVLGGAPAEYQYAPLIWAVTVIGAVAGSLMTRPTDAGTLATFYRRVRPFGFWKPVVASIGAEPITRSDGEPGPRAFGNVCLGAVCLLSCYLSVFFVIGHFWKYAAPTIGMALATGVALYFSWYGPVKAMASERSLEEESACAGRAALTRTT